MAGIMDNQEEKAFMQALAAYSYITIPSLRSSKSKMNLYLETAQICLRNGCLGQAEACLRGIINLLGQGKANKVNDFYNLYIFYLLGSEEGSDKWIQEFLPNHECYQQISKGQEPTIQSISSY